MTDGLRIAHLRIAPQWAILRWAILRVIDVEDVDHKDDDVLHLGVDHIEDGLDEIALSLV